MKSVAKDSEFTLLYVQYKMVLLIGDHPSAQKLSFSFRFLKFFSGTMYKMYEMKSINSTIVRIVAPRNSLAAPPMSQSNFSNNMWAILICRMGPDSRLEILYY